MIDFEPTNFKEAQERIKELLSIIFLVVWAAPDHKVNISTLDLESLDSNGATFTSWTELDSGDFIIKAERKKIK